jgi:hypothetical protein
LSKFLKGVLPANQSVQGGERLIFSKQAYTPELKKQIDHLKENHLF